MRTIRKKMLLYFGTIIVVLLILLGFAMSGLIRSTIVPVLEDTIVQAVDSGSKEVGSWIQSHSDNITIMSSLPVLQDGSISDIQDYFGTLEDSHDIQLLFYADDTGEYYSKSGHVGNISEREYFNSLMSGERDMVITNPLISTSQGNGIFVIAHIVNDKQGDKKGMLAATITLDMLSSVVEGMKAEDGRYGWIVDGSGNVIIHKNIEKRMSFNVLRAGEDNYKGLEDIGQRMIASKSGIDTYEDPDGIKISTAYTPIPNSPGWSLGSSISKADLLRRANALFIKIAIMLISILIAIIILIDILSDIITNPISEAVGHLKKISKGDFKTRLPQASLKRKDELGALSRGIDSMQASIEGLIGRTRYLAYNDQLTGLPNRSKFLLDIDSLIESCKETDEQFAILTIDLDNFKDINDTMGHSSGDLLLKHIAEILFDISEDNKSMVYRHGGDQFILLFREINKPEALEKFADMISERFSRPFAIKEQDLHISASMGGVIYPDHGNSAELLLQKADLSMNFGKTGVKGKYYLFKEHMSERIKSRMNLIKSLRKGIEKEEFFLCYQPIISPKTGEVECVEALIRWNHPRKGIVPPLDFIPLAEETGLIEPIGEWVLWEACKQNKQWQDKGYQPFRISVNISVRQLQRKNFTETIKRALKETGLDPKYLVLEITESEFMKYIDTLKQILEDLSEIGVGVSLDDFGIGYSSFSYLQHLPIN
ncbi:MAG TPA: EAL domain-containing protein, partial [Bacillota bacterium]|nr:EAL domain-containing protein [Bacillota bacterium]